MGVALCASAFGWRVALGRGVSIMPLSVTVADEENNRIERDLAREQMEGFPSVDGKHLFSRHQEIEFRQHFGWLPCWESCPGGWPLLI